MSATTGEPTKRISHVLLAAAVGSALEWYDFFIYGTGVSAGIRRSCSFPNMTPRRHARPSFATFARRFLARPFGGLFFGHFGDRWGRKPMLVATLAAGRRRHLRHRAAADLCAIGIWAPILLLLLRLVQGFGAGAEYGGAVIMAVEFAPPGKRGLYGGFAPMGTRSAMLLAAGVSSWSAHCRRTRCWPGAGASLSWFPRCCSASASISAPRSAETPVFQAVARHADRRLKLPAIEALRRHPAQFLGGGRRAAGRERPRLSLSGLRPRLSDQHAAHAARQSAIIGRDAGQLRARCSAWCSSPGCRTRSGGGRSICSARCSRPPSPSRSSCWPTRAIRR